MLSSSPYRSQVVYVPKRWKCKDIYRLYRVEQNDKKVAYPLPLLSELRYKLTGCSIFSSLDLVIGKYHLKRKVGKNCI